MAFYSGGEEIMKLHTTRQFSTKRSIGQEKKDVVDRITNATKFDTISSLGGRI